MFKKTLLAIALSGAATSAMAAATSVNAGGNLVGSTVGTQAVSFEGSIGKTTMPIGNITQTLGATADGTPSYGTFSGVLVTVTGGTLAPATDFDIQVEGDDDANEDIASAKTLGTVDYPTANSARLNFGGADVAKAQAIEESDQIIVKGLVVKPDSLAVGAEVTVTIEALSAIPGSPLETKSVLASKVINQFTFPTIIGGDLAGHDGTASMQVNVADARNSWDRAGNKVTDDNVELNIKSALIDTHRATAVGKQPTYKLVGSTGFAFLDSKGAGSGKVDTSTITTTTGTPAVSTDYTSVTEVPAAVGAGIFDGQALDTLTENFNFDVTPGGSTATKYTIEPQSFNFEVTLPYVDASGKAQTATLGQTAGSWKLNGSSVTIPYMPFGDNTAVILRATNTSSVEGNLTVRYLLEDGQSTWKTLENVTTIKAGVNNIAAVVMDAVKADAGVTKGKVALELTTNSPANAITMFAAYKVISEQDRGFVGTYGAKAAGTQGN